MSSKRKHSVGLRFIGEGLNPDNITALLGIEPTRQHRQGDIRRTGSGRQIGQWKEGGWFYTVKSDDHESLEEALARVLQIFSELKDKVRSVSYRPEVRVADICCGEFGSSGRQFPNVWLSLNSLEALAEMGLEFWCEFYGWKHAKDERE